MTLKQIIAIIVAVIAAVIVFKIPPYYDSGGLIGGTGYYPFSHPPLGDIHIGLDTWMLEIELSFVAISLVTAIAALRRRSPSRQGIAPAYGLILEATIFAISVPSFNTVLAPEFTFYLLNLLAIILLAVVIVRGCGPNPVTNPDANQYPI